MPKKVKEETAHMRLTPEVHKRVMSLVLKGVPVKLVYGLIGCRAADVFNWMAEGQAELERRRKGDPMPPGVLLMDHLNAVLRFYCDVTAAVDTLTAKLSTVPVKAALTHGDWHAAKWLLTQRAPDIYDEKKADKPDGDHTTQVNIIFPDNGRGPKK